MILAILERFLICWKTTIFKLNIIYLEVPCVELNWNMLTLIPRVVYFSSAEALFVAPLNQFGMRKNELLVGMTIFDFVSFFFKLINASQFFLL